MRILILSHNLIERGNYFRALKFASRLADKGHEVTFIPSSYRWYRTNRYKRGKVHVIESPSFSLVIGIDDGWSPLGILYRIWQVIRHRYDVVYGFSHKPVDFIPALFSRLFRGSFYVTDWCDWWGKGGLLTMIKKYRDADPNLSRVKKKILETYDRMEAVFEEFVPKRAGLVTVICKALEERAASLGIPGKRILKLVSGADTDTIRPGNKGDARNKTGLNAVLEQSSVGKKAVILGYTANYHLDEHLLLEAFSRVSRERKEARLLVVGPEFRVNPKLMKDWGLSVFDVASGERIGETDNIIHFGRRPFKQVPDFLAASDILLLPMTDILYNRGRWPHKIGDYLAAGRPVVVNDVGDIPDLIRDRNVGRIAAPEPGDFADKIVRLMDEKGNWDRYGKNARRIAETDLSWEKIAEKLHMRLLSLRGKKK